MSKPILMCRCATVFKRSGELDEENFRRFLNRFVESKHGLYVASGGSGEGHSLTWEELRRVYAIAVDECKGKIPVYANPPEQNTARATLEQSLLAIESGVEAVNVYGPAGFHGYRPTDDELLAYYDELLPSIKHPIALAPNPVVGYTPKASLIADVCRRYSQVVAINLSGLQESYYFDLRESLRRDVAIYVPLFGMGHTLSMGAAGLVDTESNILPKTFRRYLDFFNEGNVGGMEEIRGEANRFIQFVARWASSHPRWIKMAMRVLKLPGGEGAPRPPYRIPSDAEMDIFEAGLLKLRIAEIDEQAKAVLR